MKIHVVVFLLAGLAFASHAHGFDLKGVQPIPPHAVFSAFSAESLKKGNTAYGLSLEKSRQPDFYRFTAQFGYGITDNMETGITVPYVTDWQKSSKGFEDIAINFKHRFFNEGNYGPSVAYILFASVPSGKNEFSTEGSYGAGMIVSKKIGPVKGHANIFYSRPGTKRFKDDITFAGGIDFSASHAFKILGELYGKKSYSGKLDRLEARFGYRLLTTENLFTTIGAGFDLKNRSPEYRLMLSVTYHHYAEKKRAEKVYEMED